jgi:hypothetical protein
MSKMPELVAFSLIKTRKTGLRIAVFSLERVNAPSAANQAEVFALNIRYTP